MSGDTTAADTPVAPTKVLRPFALVLREAPSQLGTQYSTGVLATVLDEENRRVGEHWSSNTSFGRSDGGDIAQRHGGRIEQVLDLTVFGRPWAVLPIQGQHGCPLCGNVVWDQYAHVRTCPPGQDYEDAPQDAS